MKKKEPPKPKFDKVSDVIDFLRENKMFNYSIQISIDGSCSLIYGSKRKSGFKSLDELYKYLRISFKE